MAARGHVRYPHICGASSTTVQHSSHPWCAHGGTSRSPRPHKGRLVQADNGQASGHKSASDVAFPGPVSRPEKGSEMAVSEVDPPRACSPLRQTSVALCVLTLGKKSVQQVLLSLVMCCFGGLCGIARRRRGYKGRGSQGARSSLSAVHGLEFQCQRPRRRRTFEVPFDTRVRSGRPRNMFPNKMIIKDAEKGRRAVRQAEEPPRASGRHDSSPLLRGMEEAYRTATRESRGASQ